VACRLWRGCLTNLERFGAWLKSGLSEIATEPAISRFERLGESGPFGDGGEAAGEVERFCGVVGTDVTYERLGCSEFGRLCERMEE